ncbi:uncharacterized protein LOC108665526 isoform X2 [Hyalella azteca]|uniref:Uncharacterized protein LOC108665526 isoform X1 n=1 Tax=Hyalella azteca TaxID=294128 RepID=A0A8B7N1Q6_HYAAZ|nr:uncharacterized protein LOC108665526 isoform X1 [Hyalella azteca]XP_018007777.1 uncharacterized protein LOC108665526 isoform X2 [Hyalella azteca]
MPVQSEEPVDYKRRYKNLKRKLRLLIYENECFKEELEKANRALLQIQQDKSFLLEQLLPYHQPEASSSDSDLTDYSDTESGNVALAKKKRSGEGINSSSTAQASASSSSSGLTNSNFPLLVAGGSRSVPAGGKGLPRATSGSKPSSSAAAAAAAASTTGKKRTVSLTTRGGKQAGRGRQKRAPTKPTKDLPGTLGVRLSGQSSVDAADDDGRGVPELSREEVERDLLARQTIAELHTPVSLTLPNQLFSDNIMDGDLLEDMETTSNLDEDAGSGLGVYEE